MAEWRDHGVVLSVRPFGEDGLVMRALTREHGLHAGLARWTSKRRRGGYVLQPGVEADLVWRARLEDHIGSFTVEPVRSRAAVAMGDRLALAGLNAVTALVSFSLPEREVHLPLYQRTEALLDLLGQGEVWPLAYLRWEVSLLEELGYGLDLSACAVTGAVEGLAYVSPKSGRAVSEAGAGEWVERLLPLPDVLRGVGAAPDEEIAEAFRTTGYFLSEHLAADLGGKPLPQARARFVEAFDRSR